jgi:hypothetical protein
MGNHLVRGLVVGVTLACAFACSDGNKGDDDDDDDDAGSGGTGSGGTGTGSGGTGNSSGGTGNSSSGGNAVALCNDLVETYCPAIVDCAVGAGTIPTADRDSTVSACTTGALQALDCSQAVSVSSSYGACIDALENPDCDAINAALASNGETSPLPSVCSAVITLGGD